MNSPGNPLGQIAAQIALLSRELAFTGDLLFASLEKPMNFLKAGRAPRTLGLGDLIAEAEGLRNGIAEILTELRAHTEELVQQSRDWKDAQFAEQLRAVEGECAFWQAVSDRSQILLKKLTLIAELEKLSPLGRAPIQDAWEEIRALAVPPPASH